MKPATLLRLQRAGKKAAANHPKFIRFLNDLVKTDIPAGSIVEITVTRPGKAPLKANLKVQEGDQDLLKCLKELS